MINLMKKIRFLSVFLTLIILNSPSIAYTTQDIECLALTIYFEARGEPQEGKIAVAFVVLNRVKSKKFPSSICDVVFDRCQFSWTCDKISNIPKNKHAWNKSKQLATDILAHKYKDNTKGAQFFHKKTITPKWAKSLTLTTVIDNHKFYKL